MKKLKPIHPGEILKEEFLIPLKISNYKLAKDIGVTQTRIGQIIRGERSISIDTAIRLSIYFDTSIEIWINLQNRFDIEISKQQSLKQIRKEVKALHRSNKLKAINSF